MKYPDGVEPPWAPYCLPLLNIYDCEGETALFWLIVITLVAHLPPFITVFYIIWYRHRQGIAKSLFYRIDRYHWLPNPIDCLVTIGSIGSILRILSFTILLTDWPKSFLVRNIVYIATITTPLQCIMLFIIGVIAHIPSALIQPKFRLRTRGDRLRIWAPSPQTLSRIMYIIVPLFSLVNQPLSVVMGLAEDAGDFSTYNRVTTITTAFLAIFMVMLSTVTVYYQFGFHRIMTHHMNNLSELNMNTSVTAERAAAARFRTIFRYLSIGLISTSLAAVFVALLRSPIRRELWVSILFFSIQNIVVIPVVFMIIFWQIRGSSFAHTHRREQSLNTDPGKAQDHFQSSQSHPSTTVHIDMPEMVFAKTSDPQQLIPVRAAKDDLTTTDAMIDDNYYPIHLDQILQSAPLTSRPSSILSSPLDRNVETGPPRTYVHKLLSLDSRQSSSITHLTNNHDHSTSSSHQRSSPLSDDLNIQHSDTEHSSEFRNSDHIDAHTSHSSH
jgi:hypothetical protein